MSASKSWRLKPRAAPVEALLQVCGGQRYLAELLAQRGIDTAETAQGFLHIDQYRPAPPDAMVGVRQGAEILRQGLAQGRRILVWGDFDVDGQTSTALLTTGLRRLAPDPDQIRWHVPDRLKDNHGIHPHTLRPWLEDADWRPDILLTCDTGIDEEEGLALARAQGLQIIVTDHHALPPAFADVEPGTDPIRAPLTGALPMPEWGIRTLVDVIINPKLMDAGHPQYHLPGVGMAFLLIQQLYRISDRGEEALELLDFLAIGVVGDIAEQIDDTRYWLQRGLRQLNETRRPGLRALLEDRYIRKGAARAEDIAFSIAPKMNAAGRLDDAGLAVELLLTEDGEKARGLVRRMIELNDRRREIEARIHEEARALLHRQPNLLGEHSIVLAHKEWHPGVLGIVASRVLREYHRPVVLLNIQEDGMARGSARSIDGVDIGAAIASAVIASCDPYRTSHGGHEQAAGVTLPMQNLPGFRTALEKAVPRFTDARRSPHREVDLELRLHEIDMRLAEQLAGLEPTGKGNPEPTFLATELAVEGVRRFAGAHLRFRVRQADHPYAMNAVYFRAPVKRFPEEPIDLVFAVRISHYGRRRSLELRVIDWRPSGTSTLEEEALDWDQDEGERNLALPFVLEDLRGSPPAQPPSEFAAEAVWYAEDLHLDARDLSTRLDLRGPERASRLVIWSAPPNREVLLSLLGQREWTSVAVGAFEGTEFQCESLLSVVWRMCRFAVNSRGGQIDIALMAVRLGLTESVIKLCLVLLDQQRRIQFDGEMVALPDNGAAPGTEAASLSSPSNPDWRRLQEALVEIRSFRHLLRHAEDLKPLLAR